MSTSLVPRFAFRAIELKENRLEEFEYNHGLLSRLFWLMYRLLSSANVFPNGSPVVASVAEMSFSTPYWL